MVPAYLVDEHNHVLYVNVHECRRKNSSNSNASYLTLAVILVNLLVS